MSLNEVAVESPTTQSVGPVEVVFVPSTEIALDIEFPEGASREATMVSARAGTAENAVVSAQTQPKSSAFNRVYFFILRLLIQY